MTEKNLDQFKTTELFDQNDYQEIHMATSQQDADVVAVINTIKKTTGLDEQFLEQAQLGLKGLIHSEATTDSLILVTTHCNGDPLTDWLENTTLTDDQSFQFTNSYLDKIISYDHFAPYFAAMLADSSQIVMTQGQICMSEMIFIDDRIKPFAIPATEFNMVREKVSEVLTLCLNAQSNQQSAYATLTKSFIENLLPKSKSLTDLRELWTAAQQPDLEKTQQMIPPVMVMPVESEELDPTVETAGDAVVNTAVVPTVDAVDTVDAINTVDTVDTVVETSAVTAEETTGSPTLENIEASDNSTLVELDALRERKSPSDKRTGLIVLAVVLVALGALAFYFAPKFMAKPAPLASFTWVKQADGVLNFTNTSIVTGKDNSITTSEWKIYSHDKEIYSCSSFNMAIGLKTSGDYKIALRVMDKNKTWSKPYAQTISYEAVPLVPLKDSGITNGDENLDHFKIKFNTPNIFEDNKVFNLGGKSLRLELGTNGKATLTLEKLNTPSNYVISFWARTSQLGKFDLTLTGLKNGQSRYQEHLMLNPESTEAWQMVELRIADKDIDALTITVKGSGNVWLDDFQIGEIK